MTSKLDIQFNEAFQRISETEQSLPPDVLLRLYAYYKQATKANNLLYNSNENNLRSAFKFNARMQLQGMSEDEAKQEYINLTNQILK